MGVEGSRLLCVHPLSWHLLSLQCPGPVPTCRVCHYFGERTIILWNTLWRMDRRAQQSSHSQHPLCLPQPQHCHVKGTLHSGPGPRCRCTMRCPAASSRQTWRRGPSVSLHQLTTCCPRPLRHASLEPFPLSDRPTGAGATGPSYSEVRLIPSPNPGPGPSLCQTLKSPPNQTTPTPSLYHLHAHNHF